MKAPIKDIVHFHNGKGGGVLNVIRNLLKYSTNRNIRNHVVFAISESETQHNFPTSLQGAASVKFTRYSPAWNFYYTCRQLSKLLPSGEAVIVAHDWLELGMVSHLGLPNPVIQFVHGDYDYYYELAQKHEAVVEKFITVAATVQKKLVARIPQRGKDILYMRFPVPEAEESSGVERKNNIIFVGRLSKEKGYHLLPLIAENLHKRLPNLKWHIVGEDSEGLKEEIKWPQESNVFFYNHVSNGDVQRLLCEMKLFVLPSIAEGMPLSLIEAMKAGVVPLVNDIAGGVQELVQNGVTGYKISGNQPGLYADKVDEILSQREAFETMSCQCSQLAASLFNPVVNTPAIEKIFIAATENRKPKQQARVYGSRLDQAWLPNIFVSFLRKSIR